MPPRKRTNSNSEMSEKTAKIWKENHPGREQKELNRMFDNKTIDNSDTPNKIRLRHPMFQAFNPRIFALHFRTTKARYGLNAANKPKEDEADIPELYGCADRSYSPSLSDCIVDSQLETRNFPFMTWTYTDHQEKCDIVCVAVPTITGSRQIKFVLSEDGMKLFVNYVWPSVLLNPHELFRNVLMENGDPLPMEHPTIYAYQNRLSECDLSDKSMPEASLLISLPTKVQRELGIFKKQGITIGDTKLVMVQFTAYQKKKVIVDADTSITF